MIVIYKTILIININVDGDISWYIKSHIDISYIFIVVSRTNQRYNNFLSYLWYTKKEFLDISVSTPAKLKIAATKVFWKFYNWNQTMGSNNWLMSIILLLMQDKMHWETLLIPNILLSRCDIPYYLISASLLVFLCRAQLINIRAWSFYIFLITK